MLQSHDRDCRIVLSDGHVYTVDGKVQELSATRLIETPWKPFNAADALRVARENGKYKRMKNDQDVFDKWNKIGEDAATHGRNMHKIFECELKGEDKPVSGYDDELQMMRTFMNTKLAGCVVTRIEKPIFHEVGNGHCIVGTPDMVFWNPATQSHGIVDWKRCADITKGYGKGLTPAFKDVKKMNVMLYSMQIAVYAEILRRSYGVNVDIGQLFVVNCYPTPFRIVEASVTKVQEYPHTLALEFFDNYDVYRNLYFRNL